MPGSMPATSQLDWLISTTVMIVLSWSRATRALLKSFGWGIRALHQLATATMVPSPRRLPHTISPLEGAGFEPSVPRQKDNAFRDSSFPTCARATAAFENARRIRARAAPLLAGNGSHRDRQRPVPPWTPAAPRCRQRYPTSTHL